MIEIVEFYPIKQDDEKGTLTGTLHVFIIDIGVDLRGIYVIKKGSYWWFNLPQSSGFDQDAKERVRYPIFSYADVNKTAALKKEIIERGKEYILDWLEATKKERACV